MDDLKWMQQVIWNDYPMLETNILSSSDALHVWKNKTDTKGLKYLVNFHLIFKVQNDCTIIANLITFNGKTVDSLVFHRSKDDHQNNLMSSVISDHLKVFLNDFSTDHDLCQGVDRNNIQENSDGILVEFLNDTVIARSLKCRFKLKSNPEELFCEECAKLKLVKVEPVVNITKIEDNNAADEDIKNVLALTISEPNNVEGYESGENYRDLENNIADGFDAEDCDADDDWGVTLYKNDEPMKHYGTTPNKLKNTTTSSDDATYYPNNSSNNTRRPKRKKKMLRTGSSGTKCRPIIEPVDPNEERKKRVERVKQMRIKKLGGRPTDAERELDRKLVKIKCRICLRIYKSKSSYEDDMSKHAQYFELTGSVICPLCQDQLDKRNLTQHFDEKHSESQPTTCCTGCLLVITNTDGALRKHIVKHHHNQNICETCGKVFTDLRLFDVHVKSAHTDVKDHFCDRCGKAFAHRILLERHMNHSCSLEEWKCPICSKIFSCKEKLRFHLATHCDLKPYQCRYCPYSSNKHDNICIHVKKVHKLRGHRDDTTVLPDVLKLQRQFILEQFAKVKVDSTKVRKPYQRMDSSGAHPYSKAMQVPQICHLCGKTYASGDTIRRHLDVHSGKRPYKCKVCGYSALKASIVTVRHFNLFHADEGLTENDILAVDETELEEMKEFSTREFMNLRPASEVELNSNNMTDDQDMQDQDQSGAII